ncbi:MAG: histidine kinase, partial [Chloroflexi bacterium]|nr:histidine kinase [Chloroflexota bacterium]
LVLHDVTREREVDRMKTDFISVASHELRTPMTAIFGFTELLLDRSVELSAPHREWLRVIHGESKRLSDIVEDLLNISRIEAGRLTLKLEDVPLRPLADRIVEQLAPGHPRHEFRVDIPDEHATARADADKLHRVVYNLVDNAVKYSPKGGRVEIKTRAGDGPASLVISVSDQGLGIPAEEISRLFTRFHRVDRPETTGLRGTGLGLYIVKSLVDIMGGKVWVQSEVNTGSTFFVTLPTSPVHVSSGNEVDGGMDGKEDTSGG